MIPQALSRVYIPRELFIRETQVKITRAGLTVVLLLCLFGCMGVTVEEYAGAGPRLDPEAFFNGQLRAQGVVKNRRGVVIRYFHADINAYWRDGIGTLEEDFVFDDGSEERRVWTLEPGEVGVYRATASDVLGAGEAKISGNAMFLDYVLSVPYKDGTIAVSVDDRMYLVSPDTLINESVMRKFGIRVGEILLSIQRIGPDARR